jgi:energy-coupling factor transport system ATP-binding protein
MDPEVLLLDEPTRGMDQTHRAGLVDLLHQRSLAGGATLLATHDLDLARACAHERWTIEHGHLDGSTSP